MKRHPDFLIRLAILVIVSAILLGDLVAASHGLVVPPIRGTSESQAGHWEVFGTPVGTPGNRADQSGGTPGAVLTQSDPGAVLTGSGNIYNRATSAFTLTDSMTLDTAGQFGEAFVGQPFQWRAKPAHLARWMYPFNGSPGDRPVASAFGSIGSSPDFDSRDAQVLLGWSTTNLVSAGWGKARYLIRRARVTLTISSDRQYLYTPGIRDYRTYFPTNDPRHLTSTYIGSPVELYGAGFRGGFTALTYPQDGPWGVDSAAGFHSNRVAFAAGYDTNGVLVDVSNNIGDDGTNEISGAFEVAPFAVGESAGLSLGDPMPVGSQLTFDLNLADPLIYGYLQEGLNSGNLSFIASSLVDATLAGPPTYPSFYTIFSPLATPGQFPILDLEGALVRTELDSDLDGLPDDWENFHFGSLLHDAAADPDGDGMGNRSEFECGTLPWDRSSLLRIHSLRHDSGVTETHSSYGPGREFVLQWLNQDGSWQSVADSSVRYSSPWLSKTEGPADYPSPVSLILHDPHATESFRLYRVRALEAP